MNGYTGKILSVNLSDGKIETIDTAAYEQWVGGHGMGSAIFWDLVPDKSIGPFDEANVVTIMTSPMTGTLIPGGASRVEVQGIGAQPYPEWFTRSNFGGRFGAMLKFAGWDGIVIRGKAEKPVWLDVRDDKVRIRSAANVWGMDTWETQEALWNEVAGGGFGKWISFGEEIDSARTTQRPAVLTIGPSGENLARVAALIHDAGNAAGQGGFGAVWGSKKLKAISVVGTGSVEVADPAAVLEARLWAKRNYNPDVDDPDQVNHAHSLMVHVKGRSLSSAGSPPASIVFWKMPRNSRPSACFGCPSGCRTRTDTGGNGSCCADTEVYNYWDLKKNMGIGMRLLHTIAKPLLGDASPFAAMILAKKPMLGAYKATDLCQKEGVNAKEITPAIWYLRNLYKMGVLGPGKEIDYDLPFDKLGDYEFIEKLIMDMSRRRGIGDDLAEGMYRAAKRWGRLDEDLNSGLLPYSQWGMFDHYDPRVQVEWGYGTLMGDRDINEHGFNLLGWIPKVASMLGLKPVISAEEAATIFSDRMEPFAGDMKMLDYSEDNMYSESIAKTVAWHRRYTRFWKQSTLYCNFLFPDFLNLVRDDKRGMVGEAEPKFLNAVTGKDISFADGIELGRKIWNLDNAIWTLQGKHRDMARFADYIYDQPLPHGGLIPGMENGKWKYINAAGRSIDRDKFEQWKTRFYKLEGWDVKTGWPKRETLSSLGLDHVADDLEKKDKLGSSE